MQDLLRIQRLLNDYQQNQQIQLLAQNPNPGLVLPHFEKPLTLEDVLNLVNEQPEEVNNILANEAELLLPEEFVGPSGGIAQLQENMVLQEYRFQPSDIHLQNRDYNQVKKYIRGRKTLSELTDTQQELIKALQFSNVEDFAMPAGNYEFKRDGLRFANLREQLADKLDRDGLLSKETTDRFGEIVEDVPEIFNVEDYFPSVAGMQRPGVGSAPRATKPVDMEMENLLEPGDLGYNYDADPDYIKVYNADDSYSFIRKPDHMRAGYVSPDDQDPFTEDDYVQGGDEGGAGQDPDYIPELDDMPGQIELSKIPGMKQSLYFLEDESVLDVWADRNFQALYAMDSAKYQMSPSRLDAHQQMFLDAQGIDASWDEFLIATGRTNADFDQLWGKWDEMTSQANLKQDIQGLFNLDVEPIQPELGDEPIVDNVALKTRGSEIKPFVDPDEDAENEKRFEVEEDAVPETGPAEGKTYVHRDPFAEPEEFTPVETRVQYTPEQKMEFLYRYAQQNDIDLKSAFATDGSDMYLNVDDPMLDFASPSRMLGLAAMPGLMGIQQMIEMAAPGTTRWLNLGMGTLDLVTSGNPLGLAWQGMMELINEINIDAERMRENDFAQSSRGSRYGFYKDENGEWKQAILNTQINSTAFGSRDKTFTIEYGDKLLWRYNHAGDALEPYFENEGATEEERGRREYVIQESDNYLKDTAPGGMYLAPGLDYPWYSKTYLDRYDPLRRWYFLTPEEQSEVFTAGTQEEISANMQQYKHSDDPTGMSATQEYTKNLLDWQKAIVLKQKLATGGHDPGATEWDPSTGLRRVTTQGWDQDWGKHGNWFNPDLVNDETYSENVKNINLPEEDWLLQEYLPKLVGDLVKTQKRAADEAGYKDTFGPDTTWEDYYAHGYTPPTEKSARGGMATATHYASEEGQTSWSSNFLALDHDMDTAQTYDELAQQIEQLGVLEESPAVIDYLQTKVTTRYFMDQLMDRGRGEDLYNTIMGRERQGPTDLSKLLLGQDNAQYGTYAMPWSNSGDLDDMLVGRDSEVLKSGLFESEEQRVYDAWKNTRHDNPQDYRTTLTETSKWQPHFEEGKEPEKQEETEPEPDINPTDASGERAWLRYGSIYAPNPKYTGPPVPNPKYADTPKTTTPEPETEPLTPQPTPPPEPDINPTDGGGERAWLRYGSIYAPNPKYTGPPVPNPQFADTPTTQPPPQPDHGTPAEIRWGDHVIGEDPVEQEQEHISDWEMAKAAAAEHGGDPIYYYPIENDGTMPEDYVPEGESVMTGDVLFADDPPPPPENIWDRTLGDSGQTMIDIDQLPGLTPEQKAKIAETIYGKLPAGGNTWLDRYKIGFDQPHTTTPDHGTPTEIRWGDYIIGGDEDLTKHSGGEFMTDEQSANLLAILNKGQHHVVEESVEEPPPPEPLTAAQEYMQEMHASDYAKGYTTTTVSYLPVTSTGESALYGDRELHDAMGLPEFITAAMDPSTGLVHQQYHPELVDAPLSNSGHAIIAQ